MSTYKTNIVNISILDSGYGLQQKLRWFYYFTNFYVYRIPLTRVTRFLIRKGLKLKQLYYQYYISINYFCWFFLLIVNIVFDTSVKEIPVFCSILMKLGLRKKRMKEIFFKRNRKYRSARFFYKVQFKYKKYHRQKFKGIIGQQRFVIFSFGSYIIRTLHNSYITIPLIETIRKLLNRYIKKKSSHYRLYLYPTIPRTKKPLQIRMGKGKGNVSYHIMRLYTGQILVELFGITLSKILNIYKSLRYLLPFQIELIYRYELYNSLSSE